MEQEFEMRRSERRSFTCSNKLWNELIKLTNDKISISTYINQAIREKMKRENKEI